MFTTKFNGTDVFLSEVKVGMYVEWIFKPKEENHQAVKKDGLGRRKMGSCHNLLDTVC